MSTPASTSAIGQYVAAGWRDDIVPALHDYISIPAISADFDPDWKANGHIDRAVDLIHGWCGARRISGLSVDIVELPGLSPLLVAEVSAFGGGNNNDTVLLYGHYDKQPEMVGWRDDLGPWKPVVQGDRLYGRGGADDGYAAFASLLAVEAAQAAGLPHNRIVMLIEGSEESGSPDLPVYLDALRERIGNVSLVLCLDSGCIDYERLWVTTSLRGMASLVLRVEVLTEGVHSGMASGVVPSSFRIARALLDRIEDSATGRLLLPELHVEIPPDRLAQAQATGAQFTIGHDFPFAGGTQPMTHDPAEQLLATSWYPTLSITGADGLPPTGRAGNVLRPSTSLRLSFRLPPTCDTERALAAVCARLAADPPYGATVELLDQKAENGWNAPPFTPCLQAALEAASEATFGPPTMALGEGGSIPFMGLLGDIFPSAQFVITGVCGPESNAHGPNEFLHLPTAEKLTACLTQVLAAHSSR